MNWIKKNLLLSINGSIFLICLIIFSFKGQITNFSAQSDLFFMIGLTGMIVGITLFLFTHVKFNQHPDKKKKEEVPTEPKLKRPPVFTKAFLSIAVCYYVLTLIAGLLALI